MGGKLKSSPVFLACDGSGDKRRIVERTAVDRMGVRLLDFVDSRWVLMRVVRWADGAKANPDCGDRMASARPTNADALVMVDVIVAIAVVSAEKRS